jgi:hypothetical protein
MNRREFLGSSTAVAAGVAAFGWRERVAAQMPNKPIVIQVGAVSFVDEGTDKELDTLAELGAVDTLFHVHLRGAASAAVSRAEASCPITARRSTTTTTTRVISRRPTGSTTVARPSRRKSP